MDRDAFDGLTKVLAASPSRRAAIGALLGTGLGGALGTAGAAKRGRGTRRPRGKAGRRGAQVSAQAADCANPGPSSNISSCNFQDADFSGDDLSGSRMVATNFRNAELVGTDLSSSNAKNAVFREANLCGANLRSSTLGGADFRAANLTLATLQSSGGCNSATFNAATTFCATTMCDGSIRNDDCAGGFDPDNACCTDADCLGGQTCAGNQCVAVCPVSGHNSPCHCYSKRAGGDAVCVNPQSLCFADTCATDAVCPGAQVCVTVECNFQFGGRCAPPCPIPDPCVCPANPPTGVRLECGRLP